MPREVLRNRDPALSVERRVSGVLHELQVVPPLLGVDARFLPLEAGKDFFPLRKRIEKQATPQASGSDELLAGLAVTKSRGEVGAALLIDRMRELTQVRRGDPTWLRSLSPFSHYLPLRPTVAPL